MSLAVIGALGGVRTHALTVGSMGCAVFAVSSIKPKIMSSVSPPSGVEPEEDEGISHQRLLGAVESPTSLGPPKKRRAEIDLGTPRFQRGFVWLSTSSANIISPAALYTETAPLLPAPPQILLDDPVLANSIKSLGDTIKVEIPFDVDKLESMLHDHPNCPFIASVMKGLQVWPCDESEWKADLEEISGNYEMDDADLQALQGFCDREMAARRWSQPLSDARLLPGMRTSPMFVAWQHGKPWIMTDHSASGLNDRIPKTEVSIKYDDMHMFGQTLHNVKENNPNQCLVTFKSDVATAFLNLPAHPLW